MGFIIFFGKTLIKLYIRTMYKILSEYTISFYLYITFRKTINIAVQKKLITIL